MKKSELKRHLEKIKTMDLTEVNKLFKSLELSMLEESQKKQLKHALEVREDELTKGRISPIVVSSEFDSE